MFFAIRIKIMIKTTEPIKRCAICKEAQGEVCDFTLEPTDNMVCLECIQFLRIAGLVLRRMGMISGGKRALYE